MSQQTLMELVIENITNKYRICVDPENPENIVDWPSLRFKDNQEVIEIDWSCREPEGSLALKWLPPTVQRFYVIGDIFMAPWITGTINLTALPLAMTHLDMMGNCLEGKISLTSLPPPMVLLCLAENRLSGTLDFTHLPKTMRAIRLSVNKFEGMSDFSKLPDSLEEIDIRNNKLLEGTIQVDENTLFCQVTGTKVETHVIKQRILMHGPEVPLRDLFF
eukprot:CAMPEP_0201519916 /NCGR_PEP_ID=MMETSP0161_2-20130828/10349_1 /ASSEMBLY_ACC=CAM_ASM_000251 /TAXON_ID=180227 /ORGANISM="Neoparamoeba aestuarina, Strain SoJaBio B1-5/56/2" /LENGTH=218 /DNA_ID=CAMNT_0047918105 /DNA_START=17 /DNA_END=676 /DNA_ORIENTATION=+